MGIDNPRPERYNSKGAVIKERQYSEIALENKNLVSKLAKIVTKSISPKGTLISKGPDLHSINAEKRRRHNAKIERENMVFLKRL